MIELAIKIKKGEGREGMLTRIDIALIGGGYKIHPGTYRVIIEPAELVEEEYGDEDRLDAIAARKALADPERISLEDARKELGLDDS